MPMLYAFNASSEGVVAFGAGTLNFWIDPIDSPRRSRMRAAATPTVASTSVFAAACA